MSKKPGYVLLLAIAVVVGTVIIAARLSVPQQAQAAGPCGAAQFAGAYGFLGDGVTVRQSITTHEAIQGNLSAQPTTRTDGTLTGNFTESINGRVIRPTFTGTYQLASCGTGTATINSSQGVTMHFDFGIADWTNAPEGVARTVQFIETDPHAVLTLELIHE